MGERASRCLTAGLPGNNVDDDVMLLSLLKCTALKEGYGEVGGFSKSTKTTDGYEMGVTHTFDYAIRPARGRLARGEAYKRGLEFNRPLIALKADEPVRPPAEAIEPL